MGNASFVASRPQYQGTIMALLKQGSYRSCILFQIEVIRANVIGTLNLADVTNEKGIHLTVYATGCIFHYDKDFPQDSGKGFTEDDTPNFTGSYYSKTKVGFACWPASDAHHAKEPLDVAWAC